LPLVGETIPRVGNFFTRGGTAWKDRRKTDGTNRKSLEPLRVEKGAVESRGEASEADLLGGERRGPGPRKGHRGELSRGGEGEVAVLGG